MLEKLKRFLANRKKEAENLEARINTIEDVAEVRKLGESLRTLTEEIRELETEIAELEARAVEDGGGEGTEGTEGGDGSTEGNSRGDSRGVNPMSAYAQNSGATRHQVFTNTGTRTSIGQHFAATTQEARTNRAQKFDILAPEYRANTDTQMTQGVDGPLSAWLVDIDRNIVRDYRRPTIADLFNWGTMTAAAIQYFVEGGREGDFATVAEGALKPQIHYEYPTPVIDSLKKIAAFIKLSDEMFDDVPYIVSEINSRLMYDLSIVEEYQLLKGDGTGTNVLGLYNRSGIQTLTSPSVEDNVDSIFRCKSMIANTTGLNADGLIINPADYETFRLGKDANGQYFGGGYFQGAYGNGTILEEPSIWGIRTVLTPMIDQGTAMVGAFSRAATPYRKGGISIQSTNSHDEDFTHNLVTIRAEERIALAVRRPAAFVKVTFAA